MNKSTEELAKMFRVCSEIAYIHVILWFIITKIELVLGKFFCAI